MIHELVLLGQRGREEDGEVVKSVEPAAGSLPVAGYSSAAQESANEEGGQAWGAGGISRGGGGGESSGADAVVNRSMSFFRGNIGIALD
jgi:hypothetical protein